MKVVIYVAVSADGFIATKDGNSDWVLDDELFEKNVKDFGCIALGHNTFKQYENEIYPIDGVDHLILATSGESSHKNVYFVMSPEEAIKKARDLGHNKLLIVGGGKCNGSFDQAGLVDEIWLDIHPLILGNGIKLLGDFIGELKLELISSEQQPEGFIHSKFKNMCPKNQD